MKAICVLLFAACSPATTRRPESIRHVPDGWIDEMGVFHAANAPIRAHFPRDAELDHKRSRGKPLLMTSFDQGVLGVTWWPIATPPTVKIVERSIGELGELFDGDAQLATVPIGVVEMQGAQLAREAHWLEDDEAWTMRVGCRPAWCVAVITITNPAAEPSTRLTTAVASVGFGP